MDYSYIITDDTLSLTLFLNTEVEELDRISTIPIHPFQNHCNNEYALKLLCEKHSIKVVRDFQRFVTKYYRAHFNTLSLETKKNNVHVFKSTARCMKYCCKKSDYEMVKFLLETAVDTNPLKSAVCKYLEPNLLAKLKKETSVIFGFSLTFASVNCLLQDMSKEAFLDLVSGESCGDDIFDNLCYTYGIFTKRWDLVEELSTGIDICPLVAGELLGTRFCPTVKDLEDLIESVCSGEIFPDRFKNKFEINISGIEAVSGYLLSDMGIKQLILLDPSEEELLEKFKNCTPKVDSKLYFWLLEKHPKILEDTDLYTLIPSKKIIKHLGYFPENVEHIMEYLSMCDIERLENYVKRKMPEMDLSKMIYSMFN